MVFIPLQITHHRKFTNIDCGKRNIGEIPGRWTKMWFLPIWVKFYRISITPGLFSGSQFGTPKSFFTSLSIFLLPTILACLRQSWPKISQLFCHVLPTSSAIDPVFLDLRAVGELWWAMVSYSFFNCFNIKSGETFANFLAQCSSALSGTRTIANLWESSILFFLLVILQVPSNIARKSFIWHRNMVILWFNGIFTLLVISQFARENDRKPPIWSVDQKKIIELNGWLVVKG